jgi:DNA-binding winged helix-turn-helix (wHTH) protein/TolB-like protein
MVFLEQKDESFRFDDFAVHPAKRSLLRNNSPVPLNPKAFDLLIVLLEKHGETVTKEELLERVWQDQFVEEGNLTVHISSIRKALGEKKEGRRYVVTVPGKGYQFVGDVFRADEALVIEEHTISRLTIEHETEENPKLLEKQSLPWLRWNVVAIPTILAIAFFGWYWIKNNQAASRQALNPPHINSIAILPFQTLNDETKDNGLELGLTESLINRLSRLKNVSVRPISTVKEYTQENRDLLKIGGDLKVDSVLEGNIQKDNNRLRITVRLLNIEDGKTLWNEQIDENIADIFVIQDKISNHIVDSLQIVLSDKEKSQFSKVYTNNVEAYKKYMVGRYQWNKRNPDGFYQSIETFKQAIDLDPTFALAYAGLADSYLLLGLSGTEPRTEAFPKARAAAEKALEIDENLAEADSSLAMVANLFDYNWQNAEKHFRKAIELKPNYSTGHHWLGLFLAMQGRTSESIEHISKAKELDPLSPSINTDLAFAYYLADQPDKAIDQLQNTLQFDSEFANAHIFFGMTYLQTKRYDEAIAEFEIASKLTKGNLGKIELIWANGFAGNKEKALMLLAELPKDIKISPFDMALIETSLDEKSKAIDYLQQAYEQKDPLILPIKVYPPFDSLRQEPRFIELLKKMNLD